jgi:hypothetical protein
MVMTKIVTQLFIRSFLILFSETENQKKEFDELTDELKSILKKEYRRVLKNDPILAATYSADNIEHLKQYWKTHKMDSIGW